MHALVRRSRGQPLSLPLSQPTDTTPHGTKQTAPIKICWSSGGHITPVGIPPPAVLSDKLPTPWWITVITLTMSGRILDATDIASNTTRFCYHCRQMFTETREKDPGICATLLLRPPYYHGRIFAKGIGYGHPQLYFKQDNPITCELCIFLRVELGEGPDQQLPVTYANFRGFALPGR